MNDIEKRLLTNLLQTKLQELIVERDRCKHNLDSFTTHKKEYYKDHQEMLMVHGSTLSTEITDSYIQGLWNEYLSSYQKDNKDDKDHYDKIVSQETDEQSNLTTIESNINTIKNYIETNLS